MRRCGGRDCSAEMLRLPGRRAPRASRVFEPGPAAASVSLSFIAELCAKTTGDVRVRAVRRRGALTGEVRPSTALRAVRVPVRVVLCVERRSHRPPPPASARKAPRPLCRLLPPRVVGCDACRGEPKQADARQPRPRRGARRHARPGGRGRRRITRDAGGRRGAGEASCFAVVSCNTRACSPLGAHSTKAASKAGRPVQRSEERHRRRREARDCGEGCAVPEQGRRGREGCVRGVVQALC